MTIFDVFTRREVDDTGLPEQASDAELLAWGEDLRALPEADDDLVIDLREPRPKHIVRRPLVAAPEPRRVLRARPLVAPPAERLDAV